MHQGWGADELHLVCRFLTGWQDIKIQLLTPFILHAAHSLSKVVSLESRAGLSWLASHAGRLRIDSCFLKGGLSGVWCWSLLIGLSHAGHSLMLSPMLSQGWSHAGLSWLTSLMLVAQWWSLLNLMLVSLGWPLSCWSLSGGLSWVSCWSLLVALMLGSLEGGTLTMMFSVNGGLLSLMLVCFGLSRAGLSRVVPQLWCSLLRVFCNRSLLCLHTPFQAWSRCWMQKQLHQTCPWNFVLYCSTWPWHDTR